MNEYKVASIIDNRTLVVNAGLNAGISVGDKFKIFSAQGKIIKDPDSGKSLGKLEIEKMPVVVVKVEENFSVAETFKYREVNEGGTYNGFNTISNYLQPPKIKKVYDSFDMEDTEKREIDIEKSIVKIGDIVRKIEVPKSE